jgi:RND family efflux transporter MFP subunit
MIKNIFFICILVFAGIACNTIDNQSSEDHGHAHDDIKLILTAYNEDLELFAEADPFVVGKSSNIQAHFTNLTDFSALEDAKSTITLRVIGEELSQSIDKPEKPGIYSFDLTPEKEGFGVLFFEVETPKGRSKFSLANIQVFTNEHDAVHAAESENAGLQSANALPFTKEQSWKVDFSTGLPKKETFGALIKTSGRIGSAQGDEILISAKTSGIAVFSDDYITEGKQVKKNYKLFTISGSSMADNNMALRFAEAKNDYERAKINYERSQASAKDGIISEKALTEAKAEFENANARYISLKANFSSNGQIVKSPMKGFVKHLFVQNGEFVEAGDPVISISQNKTLLITADVRQRHASLLPFIKTATIKTSHNDRSYRLEELNGKILSFGKHTNDDNYMIPIILQIENKAGFISGSFVELFLKSNSGDSVLTVPNEALIEDMGVFRVFVQITPELYEIREVKTGVTDGFRTEILTGINADERIVTKGAIFLKLSEGTGTLDAHAGHVH